MVQKEVAKKSRTYGIIGILLAIFLVALIYSYGGTQVITPNSSTSPAPSTVTTSSTSSSQMQTFASYEQLKDFLDAANNNSTAGSFMAVTSPGSLGVPAAEPAPSAASASSASGSGTNDFSTTNDQVAGVDEADTVKTDGSYLYVVGNNSEAVYILDANPQSAQVLGTISLPDAVISGIYLNGTKLAVVGNQYESYYVDSQVAGQYAPIVPAPYWGSDTTFVYIYDVSDKANPVLTRNFTISGNYVDSRMIGNYVYDIVDQDAWVTDGTVMLPEVFSGPNILSVDPTTIYYADNYANATNADFSYTTIVSLDMSNDAAPTSNVTIMMGSAGAIYVSPSNIYVTYPTWSEPIAQPTVAPIQPSDQNANITIAPAPIVPTPIMVVPNWEGTAIYRIQISGVSMTFAAQGNVTGNVLGQYSMDEYNGYFRIATTSFDYNQTSWWSGVPQTNIYVLNMDLQVVGKLENLASGETLHAARFVDDRCYLDTFQQIDPFFVVDLSQPTNPQVLGNLTIPGYTDFFQPYDSTHLIGIGQDVNASIDADKAEEPGAVYYTAVLGLKVSLFDVTDVANPKEISSYVIGDQGTTSEVLNDPKALLLDPSLNLLVLPVDLYLATNSTSSAQSGTGTTPPVAEPMPAPMLPSDTQNTQFVWQGVYIFNVDLTDGLTLRGNVTQLDDAAALLANPSLGVTNPSMGLNSSQFITRSLYIGNVLYTFSDSTVQLNSLDDFSLIAQIDLN
jgi:uncharacterized secreted protein with C-terminal beta-propeller domain